MNEGMAMYLQGTWLGEQQGIGVEGELEGWVADEKAARERAGPPAAYDRTDFADINVYYGPALVWDELRRMVGDDAFWAMVRAWPATHRFQNADRQEYQTWISQQLGHDYSGFMNDWLLGKTSPTFNG